MDINQIIEWFKEWTKLKIRIHVNDKLFYFREKEIWWASLGANIGFEQNGKNENYERPIMVVRKFNKDVLWALPLTTKFREGIFYYDLSPTGNKSTLILSQMRLISSKRLIRKLGIIPAGHFNKIREKIKLLI
jgi:mRNA interferase MazF